VATRDVTKGLANAVLIIETSGDDLTHEQLVAELSIIAPVVVGTLACVGLFVAEPILTTILVLPTLVVL